MRIALLLEHGELEGWQLKSLEAALLTGEHELVLVLNCTTSRRRRPHLRKQLYYALRQVSLRQPDARLVSLPSATSSGVAWLDFESPMDGNWQSLSQDAIEAVLGARAGAILKFGMGLLRVPDADELPIPILSFHHGDPSEYRGRPAGFYELLNDEPAVGVMVQAISNVLDGGRVLALSRVATRRHSYSATVRAMFAASAPTLVQALRQVSEEPLPKLNLGKNYSLPGNRQVGQFVLALARRRLSHYLYGAFFFKEWRSSIGTGTVDEVALGTPIKDEHQLDASGFSIVADPFFYDGGVVAEATSWYDPRGFLVVFRRGERNRISLDSGHHSYPCVVNDGGERLLLPEIAQWSGPRLMRVENSTAEWVASLEIDGDPRVVDPTLFSYEGKWYLFGNTPGEQDLVLRLWVSDAIKGRYTEHPASPVLVSCFGARMAGRIQRHPVGQLIRFGQDCSGDYGNGVIAFEVVRLTPVDYQERVIGAVRFTDRKGPHTLDFDGDGRVLFDYYRDRFSIAAGIRRIIAGLMR